MNLMLEITHREDSFKVYFNIHWQVVTSTDGHKEQSDTSSMYTQVQAAFPLFQPAPTLTDLIPTLTLPLYLAMSPTLSLQLYLQLQLELSPTSQTG